jgi:hypothetical protein
MQTSRIWVRAFAVGLTLLMSWAIVASANHLFIDMALGGAVIAVAWFAVSRWTRLAASGSGVAPQPVA